MALITDLPESALVRILSFLSAADVVHVGQSNKQLGIVAESNHVWKRLCRRLRVALKEEEKKEKKEGKENKMAYREVVLVHQPLLEQIRSKQINSESLLALSEGNLLASAGTVFRLRVLATDMFFSVAQVIEDSHAKFASELFGQFEEAYDTNNHAKLREFYRILVELGEQRLAAQRFITKNPLFLNLSQVQLIAQGVKAEKVPLPEEFCAGLLAVCNEQLPIIGQVFMEEAKPLQTLFMERVFGQSVTEYGDYILVEAKKEGNSAYTRTLVSLLEAGHKLIKSLTVNLDQQELVDLMMMTFSNQASHYLECELAHLNSMYDNKLFNWNNQIVDKKKSSISVASPIEATPPKLSKRSLTISNMISIELCLEIIYENKNAIKRAYTVSYKEDLKRNVEEIFTLMLKTIGTRHVGNAMKMVIDSLSQLVDHETSDQFSVSNQLFDLIHIADLIQQMIDKFYEEDIVPLIPKDAVRNRCLIQKKVFEKQLDENVGTCFNLIIEYMIKRVEFLLRTYQKSDDFNKAPKGKLEPSHACILSIECIDSHLKKLDGATEKSTLSTLSSEIGTRFFKSLYEHFKKFKISVEGGQQLNCDLDKYYDFVSHMGVSKTKKQFQSLREVGKLFVVPPDGLKKLLDDENRFEVDDFSMEELRTFLRASRADYKDPKVAKVVDGEVCSIC